MTLFKNQEELNSGYHKQQQDTLFVKKKFILQIEKLYRSNNLY